MSFLRTSLLLVFALLLAGCASIDRDDRGSQPIPARLVSQMSAKGMSPADPIMVRIYKQESELELWKRDNTGRYALLKTYPMCRWSGKLGPKTREGDRQAPEGFYNVTPGLMNPRSQYYLAFNLGYPNQLESALGYTGSALMVHGACTSAGCYAMTNDGVAEIYAVAREALAGGQQSFQVQALPFRMTPRNFARHRNDPNMPYWRNLKEGTDLFAVTRKPPVVSACGGRYRFTPAGQPVTSNGGPLDPCPVAAPDSQSEPAVAQHRAVDEARIALLSASVPTVTASYVDGGMHESFRDILRRSGPEKLGTMTSGAVPVSTPNAALADPHVSADDTSDPDATTE